MRKTIGTLEAAARLGISQRRVVALIAAGRLKADRVGRTWIIDAADLRAVQRRLPGSPGHKPKK